MEESFTDKQRTVLQVVTKVSSSLSIIGSLYIIYHCLKILLSSSRSKTVTTSEARRRQKHRFSAEYNRILIALSFCDIFVSSSFFISPWAAEKQSRCNAQGAFFQVGFVAGMIYSTILAVYFYLFVRAKINGAERNGSIISTDNPDNQNNISIKNGEQNYRITTQKEIMLHCIILLFPISSAIFLIKKEYMNPVLHVSGCYISEYPRGCVRDQCIRGSKANFYRFIFLQIPVIICFVVIITSLILLHKTVKTFNTRRTMNRIYPNINTNEREHSCSSIDMGMDTFKDVEGEEDCSSKQNEQQLHSEESNDDSPEIVHSPNMDMIINNACQRVQRLSMLYLFVVLLMWMTVLFQTAITRVHIDDPQVYYYCFSK